VSDTELHVKIDSQLCQGTGYCVRLAANVFALEGQMGVVIDSHPPTELEEILEEAATLCPTRAITY
jgi:ferredoxin